MREEYQVLYVEFKRVWDCAKPCPPPGNTVEELRAWQAVYAVGAWKEFQRHLENMVKYPGEWPMR